ncbi:uncharacterized protein [Rutidosis leptorrhynchoides]|uniref:uncharacterized protein n=1 Tax=Rutidosis leptorrhynchoides TaxID=125765 RepID=UPI003A9A31E9
MERDPGKRTQMWEYPANLREQIRLRYLNLGPLQVNLNKYPTNRKHDRFDNWKKVNDGNNCAFLRHIGSSQHRYAVASSEASVDIVRWLTFQACAFRGHDETPNSRNCGNFIEMLKLLASYNDELAKVVLGNAPYNSKFTSGLIQKEILGIIANNVRKHIRYEVADSYFCVMVDEARDESKKEQMAIVLRFVDKEGVIRERFLNLGYDGASNMRGEWNGLQALVTNDCPYAYYVHCFAHRLQLALVASSKEVIPVHQFFTKLTSIINVVCASSKRHDELQKSKADEIKCLLELDEIKYGKGKNQSIIKDGCSSQRGDADAAYDYMKSFEFVLILHLIKEIMGMTDTLSQALQKKISRHWQCYRALDIPDFKALYKCTRYRPREHDNQVSVEHYYKVDIFICTLDKQLHEMENRFNDDAMGLLTLTSALVPKRILEACDINQICHLVKKYYPLDFMEQERIRLRYQLELFEIELSKNSKLRVTTTIVELCKTLVETRKCEVYYMLDRLI